MMKKINRPTLFLIIICVFLITVTISLGYILTNQSSAAMKTLIESRMLDVSNTAAAMLDGDVLEALEAEDKDTPAYQNAYKTLACFEENIELEYIYCVRDLGNGEFVFTIDPDADAPGEFGEHIPYTDALHQASLGTPSVDKVPYEDSWGRFYSAYSPVFNSKQQVAGIVAVDFSADWYDNQVSHQLKTTLWISGVALLFGGVMIVLITARFRKRLHYMLNEMNVVSKGIETLVHEVSPGISINLKKEENEVLPKDEITALGGKIRSLENQLSEQISFVRSQAYIDGLTGLGNRTAYKDRTHLLDDEIKEGKAAFSVAVFDMNGLKEINDRYGHEQGDQAIFQVASALKQTFGEAKLYRIGGDEFIAILDAPCSDIADRLRVFDRTLGEKDGLTTAKGYAVFAPNDDTEYREVFKRADDAMYNDKRAYYAVHEGRRESDRALGGIPRKDKWEKNA